MEIIPAPKRLRKLTKSERAGIFQTGFREIDEACYWLFYTPDDPEIYARVKRRMAEDGDPILTLEQFIEKIINTEPTPREEMDREIDEEFENFMRTYNLK